MSLILEALRKSEAERRRGVVPNVYAELPPSPRTRAAGIPVWTWLVAGAGLLVALWLLRGTTPRPPAPEPVAARAATVVANPRMLPPVPRLSPPPASVPAPAAVSKPVSPPQAAPPSAPVRAAEGEPTPPQAAPPIVAAVEEPADTGTLRLSDLSVAERQALPTLKLSMHMWNDDPAQRFVILDGNRLHEGDRIGDAVVTAITTDGVVLAWNGRRLKLPIR